MHWTERRERFRSVLAGKACIHRGPVFYPISLRIAEDLGFKSACSPADRELYDAEHTGSYCADDVGVWSLSDASSARQQAAADCPELMKRRARGGVSHG